jgi:hypothetical protein
MPRHEGGKPGVGLMLLKGLTDSIGVGPSTVKVLHLVSMDVLWGLAWPKPFGSLLMVGPLPVAGSGHVVALPYLCLSAFDKLHCGWANSNGAADLWQCPMHVVGRIQITLVGMAHVVG